MILLSRLIIFGVLVYSGLAKLGSSEVANAARDLGLAPSIAKWVGRYLAAAELLVAGLLFFSRTAYVGALAALVLFTVFLALIAWNLWQGKKPACACFGEASAAPISNWTLGRDLIFVALAVIVTTAGPEASRQGIVGGLANTVAAFGYEATLAVILLAQVSVLLAVFLRRASPAVGVAASAPSAPAAAPVEVIGWPPGTLAPAFDLPSLAGNRVTLQNLVSRSGHAVLIFTAPDCRHCTALLPEIGQWQERHRGTLTIALLSKGSAAENRAKIEDFEIADLLLQGGSEVADAYQAMVTPAAIVVDSSRRIASRLAMGAVEVRQLVAAWADRARKDAPVGVLSPPPPPDPVRLLVGDPAPPFKLPSVRGGEVDLADFGGRVTVLIFWSPACGYCRSFAPDVRAREAEQTEASAQIVFVAAGTREANEAEGFVSPLLLDQTGLVTKAYGVNGTPNAVLVDANSRVASSVAVGATEISTLLQRADLLTRSARRVQA